MNRERSWTKYAAHEAITVPYGFSINKCHAGIAIFDIHEQPNGQIDVYVASREPTKKKKRSPSCTHFVKVITCIVLALPMASETFSFYSIFCCLGRDKFPSGYMMRLLQHILDICTNCHSLGMHARTANMCVCVFFLWTNVEHPKRKIVRSSLQINK